ncbi:MAG: 2-oxoglutarate oxidoreductase [Oscillospiraceae bacterium]|jgi:2-oxoglutarate ferredoxin oxidoreductase subunit beta|nr:2-oxoglutarate oxidoreductase [Oscillospiraceae bacterium]
MLKPVFEYTKGMLRVDTNFCPGCTHGISHRLITETLDEMNMLGKTIGCGPIGCAVMAHRFMNVDMCECAHGRAPAVASGVKCVHPDNIVFTYQGDGDLASIGTAEIIHAAARGENITTFFVNNAIYGMTGGQMAPTTLVGQKSTTTQAGRDTHQSGFPIRVSELIATLDGAVYVERVALNTPANVNKAKKAVRKAFDVQQKKLGFSFVEFVSTCPTNWGLSPLAAMDFLKNEMLPYYPLGVFRSPEGGEE